MAKIMHQFMWGNGYLHKLHSSILMVQHNHEKSEVQMAAPFWYARHGWRCRISAINRIYPFVGHRTCCTYSHPAWLPHLSTSLPRYWGSFSRSCSFSKMLRMTWGLKRLKSSSKHSTNAWKSNFWPDLVAPGPCRKYPKCYEFGGMKHHEPLCWCGSKGPNTIKP